jgi:hypothetical protein
MNPIYAVRTLSVERNQKQFVWSWQCNICDHRSNYMKLDSGMGKAARHICKDTDKEDENE